MGQLPIGDGIPAIDIAIAIAIAIARGRSARGSTIGARVEAAASGASRLTEGDSMVAGMFDTVCGRWRRYRAAPATTARRVAWGATAGLVASVLASCAVPAGAAVAASPTSLVGHAAVIPAGSTALGPRPASAALRLDVVLAPRDPASLGRFLQQVYDPTSPAYHHFLARGSFGPRFGAAPSTIAAVDSALSARGLAPGPVSADDMVVPVVTTVSRAESAFGTSIVQYRLRSGRVAFGNTDAPKLASSIAPDVLDVLGLSDLQRAHPALMVGHRAAAPASASAVQASAAAVPGAAGSTSHAANLKYPAFVAPSATPVVLPRISGPSPCAAATAATSFGGYTANQIATAYGFAAGAYAHGRVGTGETVALAELEPFAASDIAAFEKCYLISTPVDTIPVDGGAGTGAGSGEAALDIENVASLAPGATIDVYEAPDGNTGVLDLYQTIANQDTAAVVSTSWGLCEASVGSGAAVAEEAVFEQMAAQGQSIVAAAGDSGSEDCYAPPANTDTALQVDDPASDPYVTGVGGTSLAAPGPPPTETAWNDGSSGYGAGGGGISQFWQMPAWQASLGVNASSSGTPCAAQAGTYCREVPDVSANADPARGYAIYYAGSWLVAGGTSAAAPLWAAFTALADEGCGSNARAGLLGPALYTHPSDLNDVTSGNNDYTGTNGGLYPATTGYDMATGLGTPTAALLAPGVLCTTSAPAGVSVSPSNRHGGQVATWTVGFTTSTTGALAAGTGTVTVTAPSSTTFPSAPGDYTVNGVTATSVPSTGAGTATIDVPVAVAAGTPIIVSISAVTNPVAGTYPAADFTVATSADITAAHPSAAVGFGSGVSAVTVGSSSAVAAGVSTWTVGFTSSASGALGTGDTVTVTAPSSTTFPSAPGDYTVNGVTATSVPSAGAGTAAIDVPVAVAAGASVTVVVSQVTNPAAGTYPATDFTVATSADVTAAEPGTGLTFTGPPSQLAFTVEPPANTSAGATFAVAVSVEDSSGVVVTTDHGTSITLAVTAGTGTTGATLHCTANPVTDVLGVATFSCSISTGGSGFTLGASSSPARTGAVSAAVDVASPPAAPASGGGSVAPAAATTTVTTVSSSDNPSAPGQQVTYTATVAPVPDGGSISFTDGGTVISGCGAVGVSATTSGLATCSVTYGAAGSRTIQARYSGDTKYAASASTTLDQVVASVSASTSVSVSVSPSAVAQGGSVSYTAQVASSSSPATGTVAFSVGSLGLCTATLAGSGSATCTATDAPVGTDTVTARYGGDPTHGPSAGTTTLSVTPKRTSPGRGYWMVGADGGVFSFGDAGYFGSVPGVGVHVGDIVGMAATPDGRGYWMVGADGGVFSFGDAGYFGSAGQLDPNRPPGRANEIYLAAPITSIVASPDGGGYWLVGANGEIVPLGDAAYAGSLPGDFVAVGDVVGAATVP